MDRHAELCEKFRRLGIDTSRPGFYDDSKFIAAQTGDPKLLEDYAEFVLTRRCDATYLSRARQIMADVAEFNLEEIARLVIMLLSFPESLKYLHLGNPESIVLLPEGFHHGGLFQDFNSASTNSNS